MTSTKESVKTETAQSTTQPNKLPYSKNKALNQQAEYAMRLASKGR